MSRGQSGEPQAGQLNGQGVNLTLATWTFAINFWAWNLIGPLSATYTKDLSLSSTQAALLVATPILVGSVGRIPVGALTDRFGGRVMFAVVSLVTIAPVLLVAFAGSIDSYVLLLVFGFFLGIGGTTFAIGIPFAKAWYEPARRGFATGVFGAGMGGTALSAFFTPRFVIWFGYVPAHVIIAVALALTALLVWTRMKDSPAWHPNTGAVLPKLAAAAKLAITWQMAFLYAVAFGGFVAFSTYLPTYLKTIYDFSLTDAGARTAGFAIAAVIARPIGGMLSDRIHPKIVVMISLAGTAVMAAVVALQPAPEIAAGATLHRDGVLPGHRYRRGVRLGGAVVAARSGRCGDRDRRRRRWFGRVLPAVGDGRDLRFRRQRLHHRSRAAQPGQPAGPAVHRLATARPVDGHR